MKHLLPFLSQVSDRKMGFTLDAQSWVKQWYNEHYVNQGLVALHPISYVVRMWHAGPETSRSRSLCQKQLWVKRLRCVCLLMMCLRWSNIRWQVINVPTVDKFPLQKGNIYYENKWYRMVKGKAENQPVLHWEDRWGDLVLHALCCNVLVCTPTTNGLGWAA